MGAAKCAEFVPHGAGSMKALPPKRTVYEEAIKAGKKRRLR